MGKKEVVMARETDSWGRERETMKKDIYREI